MTDHTDGPGVSAAPAAALAALDSHTGTGPPGGHAAEAARLGGEDAYRLRWNRAARNPTPTS
ncbi:hypothetical protein [Thermomonospora umbrina]|nr:hypothetical protein [Thermomonospora umbrina]